MHFHPHRIGTHGLYPSRDGTKLYVTNRPARKDAESPLVPENISCSIRTRKIVAEWPIPGGGSPDVGNVSAYGKTLWLSGRFDNEVYAIRPPRAACRRSRVGNETPTASPQPDRYSLGHTGNMR